MLHDMLIGHLFINMGGPKIVVVIVIVPFINGAPSISKGVYSYYYY